MPSPLLRPYAETALAARVLLNPAILQDPTELTVEPSFLVLPESPVEIADDAPITTLGWYVGKRAVHRVVSLSYNKTKDNIGGHPGPRRVIIATGVAEKQVHGWQDATTYVGGALIGYLHSGVFVPTVTETQTVPVNNYSIECIRGEVPPDQLLSADPPQPN